MHGASIALLGSSDRVGQNARERTGVQSAKDPEWCT